MKKKHYFLLLFFMSPIFLFAQQTYTGMVSDIESGAAIGGAAIQVLGKNIGTITATDGTFKINAATGDVLEITSLGYETNTYTLGDSAVINIQLLPQMAQAAGSEVVVIGYGTQRKIDVTGSITQIKGEEIASRPNTNPISSLQGRVAGLTVVNSGLPGAAPTVRIRGVNSTNSASPLYVVDGVLHDNIDFINQSDIETMDVLRDPSSIAIYGLRGANGVIAITTKRAARGQTRVNLQSSAGINKIVNLIDVTDAAGFKKLYDMQLANIGAVPFDYTNYTANTDWQKLIIRNAFLTNHSLSISNSGEKTTSLISLGYNKNQGVIKYGEYERITARLNQEIKITDNIKVGGDLAGSYWKLNPTNVTLTNALWAVPIVPVQAGEGLYYSMPSFQRAEVGNLAATMERNKNTKINRGYRFVGNIFAEIKFLQEFTWRSTFYTDLGFNNERGYTPLPYRFINLGEQGGSSDTTFDSRQFTAVAQAQNEFRKFQQDHTLTWDKNFNNAHRLTAIAGLTTVYEDNTNLNGNRRDTTVNVPNHPDFWYLNVINPNNPGSYNGTGTKNSLMGFFARANYAYKNKYLLNATIRRDGSSKFSPANRWGTFGSIGTGWVISQEDFFANIEKINFLKLRASWGKIGNSNGVQNNLYQPGISNASTAIFGDNVYTAIQAAYIPDPNLHWEIVRGIDLGLEMRVFNNRLNTEVTWYDRTTTDILTRLPIPNDTRSYFTNLGKITNRGIEVSANWNDRLDNGFSYGVGGNFSYNKNTVNSIGDKINFEILGNDGANRTITGYSIGHFYGYEQQGIYQTVTQIENSPYYANARPGDIMYRDIDGNDTITSADRTYLGTPFPPYSFALNLNFGFKGFDLLIEGQGVAGNKIFAQRRTRYFTTLNYESNRLNAWTGPGTSNIEPILDNTRGNNFLFSSYYLEPGDYVRLRTVQIGYTFNPQTLSKSIFKQARLYVSGQNLYTWTRTTGYSPEAAIGNITGGGADNAVYPIPASYTFGINLTF
ncbi:SusC/RagA family TonB-linked outer membrane protein [Haoranjiania flava]|uniref:TonB-dependent receptor n=1 Tax=Haoranjiania flava TaxID=1856322 RepID=A0AAE3IKI1_9BACT|nr:TonB-dependent receptor [Haoranjiania flava]MCU7693760.1 TonB-dependent receptor [Haoranjiania flava]